MSSDYYAVSVMFAAVCRIEFHQCSQTGAGLNRNVFTWHGMPEMGMKPNRNRIESNKRRSTVFLVIWIHVVLYNCYYIGLHVWIITTVLFRLLGHSSVLSLMHKLQQCEPNSITLKCVTESNRTRIIQPRDSTNISTV